MMRMEGNSEWPHEASCTERFNLGDRVTIVHGRDAGMSGVIVKVLTAKRCGHIVEQWRYAAYVGSSLWTYCNESNLMPWLPSLAAVRGSHTTDVCCRYSGDLVAG